MNCTGTSYRLNCDMPVHSLSVLRWQQLPWESGYPPAKESCSVECKAMRQCTQKEILLADDKGPTRYYQKMSPDPDTGIGQEGRQIK